MHKTYIVKVIDWLLERKDIVTSRKYWGVGLLSVSAIVFLFVRGINSASGSCEHESNAEIVANDKPAESLIEYGLPVDSFIVVKSQIKPNQSLGEILLKHHIAYPQIDKLVKKAKSVFDVRYIKAGMNYAVFCSKDSVAQAQYLVYENSPIEYVKFNLQGETEVEKEKKEVVIKENAASGVIESSLYETLAQNNSSTALAVKLSQIYAWTIDFYRIQKGDQYKIIYEQKWVDGELVGTGKILAALFNHQDRDFYSFYFDTEIGGEYYDEKGNSLRRAFLKAPVEFSRISSRYSLKRFHPVTKTVKSHLGTDYAAPSGTPIMASADGVILEATYKKYNGNYVKVKHNSVYTTQYLHMSKIKSGIRPGTRVKQGDVIGYVGSTGLATGPHLCYRFWKHGKQVDPYKEDLPIAEPVSDKERPAFEKEMKIYKVTLDQTRFNIAI